MVDISLIDRAGKPHELSGNTGRTLMETIREAGFDELLALCGGSCACATCHVYVDETHLERLAPMAEDENDLLDSSENRRGNSRLACQIKVDASLNGATVTIVRD